MILKKKLKLLKYQYWSIKTKLLFITIVLILSSVFLVSLLSYFRYTRDFKQQSGERNQQIIEQLSINIEAYLDELFRLSISPYYNNDVMTALEEENKASNLQQLEKRRLIEGFLDGVMISPRKDILRVFIISDETYFSGRMESNIDNTINPKSFDWYQKALLTQSPIFVPSHLEQLISNPKLKVFSIVQQLRSKFTYSGKILGVIKVDATYKGIESICNKTNMGQEGGLFIIDENETVIFSNLKDKQELEYYKLLKNTNNTYSTAAINNNKYLLNSTKVPKSNWTIVSVNSVKELNSNAVLTRNFTFLLAFACSALAIIILFVFIRSFLRPLMDIIKLMKEVKNGNLTVKFPEKRHDEIGYLASSFNDMVLEINEMFDKNTVLVKEIYEAKFLQKEAQINALYSQIRPHFIYNTLNMISMLIQCDNNEKAVDNINSLSSLLRGMAKIDKEITLKEELKLLDSYLGIQSSRYEERLEYCIDVDEALNSALVPSLLFQPIVENAVVHVCEKRKEKTIIRVFNICDNDFITFCVQDNGNGIEKSILDKLQYKIDILSRKESNHTIFNERRTGIGLVNVNKRIKIKYGEDFGIKIESEVGQGTLVKLILPRDFSQEDNNIHY